MQIQPDSEYNKDNLAIYKYDLSLEEIEQLQRLTENDLKINISQININFLNSFDDTWTIKLSTGDIEINFTYTDENDNTQTENNITMSYSDDYHIPLSLQTVNQLVSMLNHPLSNMTCTLSDSKTYTVDLVSGKFVYWDTYNGKLRFNSDSTKGYAILTQDDDQSVVIKTDSITWSNPAAHIRYRVFNFYYANQVLGITNEIQDIMQNYEVRADKTYTYDTYSLMIYYSGITPRQIGTEEYYALKEFEGILEFNLDTKSVMQVPYFLQIFREIYVLSNLQTQDMIYKKKNINWKKAEHMITYDAYETDGLTLRTDIRDNIYRDFTQMPCIAYYVWSISFNNFCSVKNTYQLQFMRKQQYYPLESLKHLEFYFVDENGVLLPNLLQTKFYLQFQGVQDQPEQIRTTGMNRVIAQIDDQ